MNRLRRLFRLLPALLVAQISVSPVSAAPAGSAPASPRERLLLDFGWKFHLGNEWGNGQSLAKSGSGIGPASVVFGDASW
ncbi:MAG TPA: hypothetical protein VI456_09810, partial [Polyangia bacterium]